MKKEKELTVPESLSVDAQISLTDALVDLYFFDGVNYTPHYARIYKLVYALNIVDGIEFEDSDDNIAIVKTGEFDEIIAEIMNKQYWINALEDAMEIVTFKKEQLLRSNSIIEEKINQILDKESLIRDAEFKLIIKTEKLKDEEIKQAEYMEEVLNNFTPEQLADVIEKSKDKNFNVEKIMDKYANKITEGYFQSDKFNKNKGDIIDTKNKELRAKELEISALKNKDSARNVYTMPQKK